MAAQSAAVGTMSPGGLFTVGALGFSDDDDRGAVAGLVLVRAPRLPPASSRRAPPGRTHIPTCTSRKTRTRRADHLLALGHLSAAKLLTPANEGHPMAATALTQHRVNHLIPLGTEEPR